MSKLVKKIKDQEVYEKIVFDNEVDKPYVKFKWATTKASPNNIPKMINDILYVVVVCKEYDWKIIEPKENKSVINITNSDY